MQIRASTTLPVPDGIEARDLYQWDVQLDTSLEHEAWWVDNVSISQHHFTTKDSRNDRQVSSDMASKVIGAAKKCPKAKDRVIDLLAQYPAMQTQGPEVRQAILDLFLPTRMEDLVDRHTDYRSSIQGNGETGSQLFRRLTFLAKRVALCTDQYHQGTNHAITDSDLKTQLLVAVAKGPYRVPLKSLLRRVGSNKPLDGSTDGSPSNLKFMDCSPSAFARAIDHILLSPMQNTSYYPHGTLLDGLPVSYIKPSGPKLKCKPVSSAASTGNAGSARRAGASADHVSAASDSSSPPAIDHTNDQALCQALSPFETNRLTPEQIKTFQKRCACPVCLHVRGIPSESRPPGWHYFTKCPHKPAGHTVTFDDAHFRDDISSTGFAPITRSRGKMVTPIAQQPQLLLRLRPKLQQNPRRPVSWPLLHSAHLQAGSHLLLLPTIHRMA